MLMFRYCRRFRPLLARRVWTRGHPKMKGSDHHSRPPTPCRRRLYGDAERAFGSLNLACDRSVGIAISVKPQHTESVDV
jgi:hypothetical protein